MATVLTDDTNYINIADSIREKTSTETEYLPSEMPAGIEAVYNAGKQAQEAEFWDRYLTVDNKERTDFMYAFAGRGWNDQTYKLPKPIRPSGSVAGMYYISRVSDIGDVDFSGSTSFEMTFYNNVTLAQLGVVDTSKCNSSTSYRYAFAYTGITRIEKLIFAANNTKEMYATFSGCSKLEYIRVEGQIGKSISFSSCTKLDVESAKSIMIALADYSGTTNEGKNTVTFASTVKTAITDEGATSPDGTSWFEYLTKKGWNY